MRYYSRTEPVGFTYHAAAYCHPCGGKLPDIDPEGNDKHPIAPWDYFTWTDDNGEQQYYGCDECGELIR